MTFNPPYSSNTDVTTGITTYADKDGKAIDESEVLAYAASL